MSALVVSGLLWLSFLIVKHFLVRAEQDLWSATLGTITIPLTMYLRWMVLVREGARESVRERVCVGYIEFRLCLG